MLGAIGKDLKKAPEAENGPWLAVSEKTGASVLQSGAKFSQPTHEVEKAQAPERKAALCSLVQPSADLWYSEQQMPLQCARLLIHGNCEVMNVYVVSKHLYLR